MDVLLPDGTVIQNVPNGISKADLTAKLQANGYDVSKLDAASADAPAGGAANLLTGPDTLLSLGSSMVAAPLAGAAGIAGTVLPGPAGQGADWVKKVEDALTIQPKTQGGALLTKAASVPFDLLNRAGVAAGRKTMEATGSPLAATAAQTALEVGPALAGPKLATSAAPVAESAAMRLMRSALKPDKKAILSGEADSAIRTMLEDGVMPTKGGLEKMRAEIDDINQQITDAITNSNANVNKLAIAKVMQDRLADIKKQVNPEADIASLKRSWLEFVNHPLLQNSNLIPVQIAQDLKRGTYKALGKKAYGEMKGAEMEDQKTLARGLKEEIAKAVPGIADLNARDSALYNASDLLANRLATSGNSNPLGIGALSHSAPNLLAWMIDRSTPAKGLLAQILYDASRPGQGPANLPAFMLEAMQAEQDNKINKR